MVNRFLNHKPVSVQLIIFIFILLLTGELLDFTLELLMHEKNLLKIDFNNESFAYIIFEVIILAPIIETFLCQFLLLELTLIVMEESRHKYSVSIFISGLIFGVLHIYNLGYMIALIILGWLFSFIYIFYKKSKRLNPFLAVLLTHSIYNLIVLVKDYSFKT